MRIQIYIILLIISFMSGVFKGYGGDPYKPDTIIENLAKAYDRIYYPFFISALQDIQKDSSLLLKKFIAQATQNPEKKNILPFVNYISPILLVYENKLINSPPYQVNFPVRWKDIPGKDNTWNLYFQSLGWLDRYLANNNTDSALTAFKVIDDWILAHDKYPIRDEPYAFNDHASSYRLVMLVKAYNKYKKSPYVQAEFEYRLQLSILSHIFLAVSLEKYMSYHNHGIIMDKSLIEALLDFPEFSLRDEFIDFAFRRMYEVYRYSFTNEGVHKEHSPCYHGQFTAALKTAIDWAEKIDHEVPADISDKYYKAKNFTEYIKVKGHYAVFGDCARKKEAIDISPLTGKQYVKVYAESGWGFIRDSSMAVNLIFKCTFNSKVHYQQDETSFILNAGGNDLIIDPGLFSYKPDTGFYEYMSAARAHNLLLADGRDFKPDILQTGLSGFSRYYIGDSTSNSGAFEMTHPHYQKLGIEIWRQLAFTEGNLIGIRDIAASADSHDYSQLFHLAPGAVVGNNRGKFIISWPNHPYILEIKSDASDHEIIEGKENPLQGWYFPEFNTAWPSKVLILKKKGKGIIIKTYIRILLKDEKNKRSGKDELEADELIRKLESIEREALTHFPPPEQWRPARK